MKLVEVRLGMHKLYADTLAAIAKFTIETPGCTITPDFYHTAVSCAYRNCDPIMLMLAVVDDQERLRGHLLAFAQDDHGRKVGWIYQGRLDSDVPREEARELVRGAIAIAKYWALKTQCVSLAFSTARSPRAMARLLGFTPKLMIMEKRLEG